MKRNVVAFLICIVSLLVVLIIGCAMQPTKFAFLNVESSLCIGCGACTKVCKGDAIVIIGNKAVIDPAKCVQCGRCVKVCPYDAIH